MTDDLQQVVPEPAGAAEKPGGVPEGVLASAGPDDGAQRVGTPPRLLNEPIVGVGRDNLGEWVETDGGAWDPDAEVYFQWTRNGMPIASRDSNPGNERRYYPNDRDYGARLVCQVTALRDGLWSDTAYTSTVVIDPPEQPEPAAEPPSVLTGVELWMIYDRVAHEADRRHAAGDPDAPAFHQLRRKLRRMILDADA